MNPNKRDPDQRARRDDRQHHVAHRLPRRCALVAGRLLIGFVEAVEHREHDQQPEGQRPRQLRAKARGRPVNFQTQLAEDQADAERDQDRGDHQAEAMIR